MSNWCVPEIYGMFFQIKYNYYNIYQIQKKKIMIWSISSWKSFVELLGPKWIFDPMVEVSISFFSAKIFISSSKDWFIFSSSSSGNWKTFRSEMFFMAGKSTNCQKKGRAWCNLRNTKKGVLILPAKEAPATQIFWTYFSSQFLALRTPKVV
mgnify:CR=1 FL=1